MIHGVDPSKSYVGYAVLDPAPGHTVPGIAVLEAIRLPPHEEGQLARLHAVIGRHVAESDPSDRWVIEAPPPAARQDTGHGWQAAIGDGVGFIGGIVAGMAMAKDLDELPVRVRPNLWRTRMIALSTRWGRPLATPKERLAAMKAKPGAVAKVERDPDRPSGFALRWRDCDHVWRARDLAAVQFKPDRCPECGHETASRADRVRDMWKACAVEFVGHWWPDEFEILVAAARGRARANAQTRQPHTLKGVADACEAVGIACYSIPDESS